ncbi:alkaline phosphatase family protein [Kineococcus sp. SYSU DK005]|uniref:alkaline phosphatase family protein n=1 Tax=Kineococcus sp. SYSU DK005 TaxID=3383126 RepID=UPI003D7F13B3
MRPKLLIVSVDGGQPDTVRRGNFFAPPRSRRGHAESPVHTVRSVYPSSTASAHASFTTGLLPAQHGIVGNRFWSRESVAEIRARAEDPLASFHPYEHSSLQAPSLLDWCAGVGLSTAAVHFPQTLNHDRHGPTPAYYCLYAPRRTVAIPTARDGQQTAPVGVDYFGERLELHVQLHAKGATLRCADTRVQLSPGEAVRLSIPTRAGLLSVPVVLESPAVAQDHGMLADAGEGASASLTLLTAALLLHSTGLDPAVLSPSQAGPSATCASYVDASGEQYFEVPTAAWVTQTALRVIERHDPDVLLLRFNQTDHAQEFLTWDRLRGSEAAMRDADEQVMATYALVSEQIEQVRAALGEHVQVLLFSDHGIDWVDTHLRPNAVLDELALADRMVFQGDSTCAYLYCDQPLHPAELRTLEEALASLGPHVGWLHGEHARNLGLPSPSPRTGRRILTCGEHAEFYYSTGPARQAAQSASHGFTPDRASMSGFFRTYGPVLQGAMPPASLIDLAPLVRRACRELFGVTGD